MANFFLVLVIRANVSSLLTYLNGWCRLHKVYRYAGMKDHELFYQKVGERIRTKRIARGLSQEGLAIAIGLKRPSMSNIEKGGGRISCCIRFAISRRHWTPRPMNCCLKFRCMAPSISPICALTQKRLGSSLKPASHQEVREATMAIRRRRGPSRPVPETA